jgi:hypothetical protein
MKTFDQLVPVNQFDLITPKSVLRCRKCGAMIENLPKWKDIHLAFHKIAEEK